MSWTHDRAKIAALSRTRRADDPELITARRNFKATRLEDHILHVVAEAPALTNEQGNKLANLLTNAVQSANASPLGGDR